MRYSTRELLALVENFHFCSERPSRRVKNSLKSLGIFKSQEKSYDYHWPVIQVNRYQLGVPNRKFKYDFIKEHGSTRGLKEYGKDNYQEFVEAPRNKVRRTRRTNWGFPQKERFQRKSHKPVPWYQLGRGHKTRFCGVELFDHPRIAVQTPVGVVYAPTKVEALRVLDSPKLPLAGTFNFVDNMVIVDYVGGSSSLLPAKHHKKYWYFLRKRGRYTFSEHHPYGDEHRIFR